MSMLLGGLDEEEEIVVAPTPTPEPQTEVPKVKDSPKEPVKEKKSTKNKKKKSTAKRERSEITKRSQTDLDLNTKKIKSLESKLQQIEKLIEQMQIPTNQLESQTPEKILDLDGVWKTFCGLRNDETVKSLFIWLAKASKQELQKFNPEVTHFYRTRPVSGLIKLYRIFLQEGFV